MKHPYRQLYILPMYWFFIWARLQFHSNYNEKSVLVKLYINRRVRLRLTQKYFREFYKTVSQKKKEKTKKIPKITQKIPLLVKQNIKKKYQNSAYQFQIEFL